MFLEDVLDGLIEINYTKLDKEDLKKAVDGGPRSLEYTQLVEWIANELRYLYKLDEHVGAISTPDDYTTFLLELSSFLKELGCQYSCLTSGTTTERLQKQNDKLLLLDFLIRELQAARILSVQNPDENSLELTINESDTAASLKKMLIALKFPKPPSNISPDMLFSKVIPKAQELATKSVDAPLFNGLLSDKQWNTLEKVNNDLRSEYTVRRKMLLKRLEVTIQSFQWSDRTRGKEDEIVSVYGQKKNALKPDPKVQLSDLLAARQHLAVIEKTSNSNVRKNTQSSVNKIIIGNVPDRGGRPSEQQPPPPEMPSWAPRNADSGRGGGRGGGGGDRGGRVQGGWNSGGGGGYQGRGGYQGGNMGCQGGGYQGGGGGFQGGGGGYQGGGGGGHQGGGGGYQGGGGGYQGGGGGYQGGGGGYQGGGGGYQGGGGGYQGGGGGYQGGGGGGYQGGSCGSGSTNQGNYQGDRRGGSRGGRRGRGGY